MSDNDNRPDDAVQQQPQPETESPSIENYIPIDEHVEEVSENGRKVQRKGIYLLPNLFTSAALFAGFYAIIAAINGDFAAAGLAIETSPSNPKATTPIGVASSKRSRIPLCSPVRRRSSCNAANIRL